MIELKEIFPQYKDFSEEKIISALKRKYPQYEKYSNEDIKKALLLKAKSISASTKEEIEPAIEIKPQEDISKEIKIKEYKPEPLYYGGTPATGLIKSISEISKKLLGGKSKYLEPPPRKKLTFIDKVRDIAKRPGELVPYVNSIDDLNDIINLKTAVENIKNGTATEEQKEFVRNYIEWQKTDKSAGYHIASMIAEMIPFAISYGFTQPIYKGVTKMSEKSLRDFFLKYAGKKGAEELEKELGFKLLTKVPSKLIGGTAQAVTMGAVDIPKETIKKTIPEVEVDNAGTIKINTEGTPLPKALIQSIIEQTIETLSERGGEGLNYINDLLKNTKIFKSLSAPIKSAILKASLIRNIAKFNKVSNLDKINKVLSKFGYHNVFNEILEERMAEVAHGVANELGLSSQEFRLPTLKEIGLEAVAFSIPMLAGHVVASALPEEKKVKEIQREPSVKEIKELPEEKKVKEIQREPSVKEIKELPEESEEKILKEIHDVQRTDLGKLPFSKNIMDTLNKENVVYDHSEIIDYQKDRKIIHHFISKANNVRFSISEDELSTGNLGEVVKSKMRTIQLIKPDDKFVIYRTNIGEVAGILSGGKAFDLYKTRKILGSIVKEFGAEEPIDMSYYPFFKEKMDSYFDLYRKTGRTLDNLTADVLKQYGTKVVPYLKKYISENPVYKIVYISKRLPPLLKKQKELIKREKAKRFKKGEQILEKEKGLVASIKAIGVLKGEYEKVALDKGTISKYISQDDIYNLFEMINKSPLLNFPKKVMASRGLMKLLGIWGENGVSLKEEKDIKKEYLGLPYKSELEQLQKVFGREFVESFEQADWREMAISALNIFRLFKSSFDLSAPFNQGVFFIGNPRPFFRSFIKMFGSAFSEADYYRLREQIVNHPLYSLALKNGLSISEELGNLENREVYFIGNLFFDNIYQKSPAIVHKMLKVPATGIKMSERAYMAFLNYLRMELFENFYRKGQKLNIENDPNFLKSICKIINSGTGRGEMGAWQSAMPLLNKWLYSARLLKSRLNILMDLTFVTKLHPTARKILWTNACAFLGLGIGLLTLLAMAGAKVGRYIGSADFGKVIVGRVHYNIWDGFQPIIVLLGRMLAGEMESTITGKRRKLEDRTQAISIFFRSKEDPLFGFLHNLLTGRSPFTGKFKLNREVINLFIPMFIDDLISIYTTHRAKGLPLAIPSLFGVGTQVYTGADIDSYIASRIKKYITTNDKKLRKEIAEELKNKYQVDKKDYNYYLSILKKENKKFKLNKRNIKYLKELKEKKIIGIREVK